MSWICQINNGQLSSNSFPLSDICAILFPSTEFTSKIKVTNLCTFMKCLHLSREVSDCKLYWYLKLYQNVIFSLIFLCDFYFKGYVFTTNFNLKIYLQSNMYNTLQKYFRSVTLINLSNVLSYKIMIKYFLSGE